MRSSLFWFCESWIRREQEFRHFLLLHKLIWWWDHLLRVHEMEVQQRCVIYTSRMALYICWCMETVCFSQWWHVHLLFWYVVHNQWKRTKSNGKERNRLETGCVETISSVTNIVNIHCQYSWTFAKRSSTGIFQIWLFDQLCVLALESNEFMAKRVTQG